MKFSNYLNEAYTADMQRLFKPYLKDIGDFLAKAGIPVNNLEFKDLGLVKPIAFSSTLRVVKDFTETSWYDDDYLICIFKRASGGVSVCAGFMERDKIKDLKIITEFGDTSGKVSDAFTAKISSKDRNELILMQDKRKDLNKPAVDKHYIKDRIDFKLSQNNNKNVKEIIRRAKAMGFKDFDFYSEYLEDHDGVFDFYLRCYYEGAKWVPGVPHINIKVGFMSKYGVDVYKRVRDLNDKPNVVATYNNSTCSLDTADEINKWDTAKEKILEFIDIYEKARELANYINSFTYRDLIIEG